MKRFTIRTHHSPEMLAQLCRSHRVHQTCICGVFNCPFGGNVNCGDVMPWMWEEIMEKEPEMNTVDTDVQQAKEGEGE